MQKQTLWRAALVLTAISAPASQAQTLEGACFDHGMATPCPKAKTSTATEDAWIDCKSQIDATAHPYRFIGEPSSECIDLVISRAIDSERGP